MRLLNFNILPQPPLNPVPDARRHPRQAAPTPTPHSLLAEPAARPGPPEQPPAVSAYTGIRRRPTATRFPPPPAPPNRRRRRLPDMLLPAEAGPPRRSEPHRRSRRDTTIVITRTIRRTAAAALLRRASTATSCGFGGVNSLPLPGAVASGSGTLVYHVQIANVGTLESNSPVMIDDVVVGSVGKHPRQRTGHADVDVRVRPDVVVPANAVATIGQTSLLGSMHVALDPPLGRAADAAGSSRARPSR